MLRTPQFKRLYSFVSSVQKLLQEGRLEADKSQEYAINYLSNLARGLERGQPSNVSNKNVWTSWTDEQKYLLRGAYVYGSVGSGKTMLMDMFYENVKITAKSRFHFNQFMLQFHSSNLSLSLIF